MPNLLPIFDKSDQQVAPDNEPSNNTPPTVAPPPFSTTSTLRLVSQHNLHSHIPTTEGKDSDSELVSSSSDVDNAALLNIQKQFDVRIRRGSLLTRSMPPPKPIKDIAGGKKSMHAQLFACPTVTAMSEDQLYQEGKPGEGW